MADPAVVDVPEDAWLKVATNVLTGYVHILKYDALYQQTYRLTGVAAPTLQSEGAEMSRPGAPIEALSGIDVYIYCTSAAGKVRVDV